MQRKYLTIMALMSLSGFTMAVNFLFFQLALENINFQTLMFFRFLIPGCLILIFCQFVQFPRISVKYFWLHLLRAIALVASQYALFFYLHQGSLVNGTLLFLTSPMFVPLINRLIFKRKHSPKHYVCIMMAFIGVIVVLHPGLNLFEPVMLIGLSAGLCNACAQIVVHKVAQEENVLAMSLWMYSLCTVLSLSVAFVHPVAFEDGVAHLFNAHVSQWLILVGIGALSILNQNCRTKAYGLVNKAASISPFVYLSLLFSVILSMVVYGQYPSLISVLGMVIIGVSIMIMVFKFNFVRKFA